MHPELVDLVNKHKIQVLYIPGRKKFVALPGRRLIIIGSTHTMGGYLTAVHEVAHVVHRPAYGSAQNYKRNKLACEGAAWRWALEHTGIPPSALLSRRIQACLSSYLRRPLGVGEQLPGSRDIVWTLLRYGNLDKVDFCGEYGKDSMETDDIVGGEAYKLVHAL